MGGWTAERRRLLHAPTITCVILDEGSQLWGGEGKGEERGAVDMEHVVRSVVGEFVVHDEVGVYC